MLFQIFKRNYTKAKNIHILPQVSLQPQFKTKSEQSFEICHIIRLSQSPSPVSAFKVDFLAIPHDSAPIAKRPLSSFSAGPR